MKMIAPPLTWLARRIQPIDETRAREALSCYLFLGFGGDDGGRDLLRRLCASHATARLFAVSPDFGRARSKLGRTGAAWTPAPAERCLLLVANASLRTLSVLAEARLAGWHLVVEACPFSRNFILPLATRAGGVELQPGPLLPARHRALRRKDGPRSTLFVTFCDRPARSLNDGVEVMVAGVRCHLSALDALLMMADFDEVHVLGRDLGAAPGAEPVDWAAGRIRGEALFRCAGLCGTALAEVIAADPGGYLGLAQLVTRSVKYRMTAGNGRKSVVKSLLHYCQGSGAALPDRCYLRLLHALEEPAAVEPVRS